LAKDNENRQNGTIKKRDRYIFLKQSKRIRF